MANPGFTLLETLVTISLLTILGTISLIVGLDNYQKNMFQTDVKSIFSALEKARSDALNNLDNEAHGIRLEGNKLISFSGQRYTNSPNSRIESLNFHLANPSYEIIFQPLTGNSNSISLVLSNGTLTQDIKLNAQGIIE
jgi:prepilin-type N-terminal cleavage/methylation domain-containing protein